MAVKRNSNSSKNNSNSAAAATKGAATESGAAAATEGGAGADFWTPTREVALFRALIPRKVAGPLKHFHMAAVLHDIDKNHSCKHPKSLTRPVSRFPNHHSSSFEKIKFRNSERDRFPGFQAINHLKF